MAEKDEPTMATVDMARVCLGGYQGLNEDCPATIEGWCTGGDGKRYPDVHGMINECKFGDQCGAHACYCNHPDATWRKCGFGFRTGGEPRDRECKLFEPNPFWQERGDFWKSRAATVAHMIEIGKLRDETGEFADNEAGL